MISLFDSYRDRFGKGENIDGKQCSYYSIAIEVNTLFTVNNNNYDDNGKEKPCYEFIQEHFERGAKAEAFSIPFAEKYYSKGKHEHTVSLYLLGLSLRYQFCQALEDTLYGKISDIRKWYDFRYTWFLTCLYHDVASCVEANNHSFKMGRTITGFLRSNEISETPFSYKPILKDAKLTRYPESIIRDYFSYRNACGEVDHGIVGGYLLFQNLKNNFDSTTKDKEFHNGVYQDEEYRYWRKEHVDHFAYVADAIICHNIWTSNSRKTDKTYREYGLDQLIIGRGGEGERLRLEDYPLQFMLDLLDTIEPVKRFKKLTPQKVLSNINISGNPNMRGILVEWNQVIRKQPEFFQWMQGVESMKNWLDLNISTCKCGKDVCSIRITF